MDLQKAMMGRRFFYGGGRRDAGRREGRRRTRRRRNKRRRKGAWRTGSCRGRTRSRRGCCQTRRASCSPGGEVEATAFKARRSWREGPTEAEVDKEEEDDDASPASC